MRIWSKVFTLWSPLHLTSRIKVNYYLLSRAVPWKETWFKSQKTWVQFNSSIFQSHMLSSWSPGYNACGWKLWISHHISSNWFKDLIKCIENSKYHLWFLSKCADWKVWGPWKSSWRHEFEVRMYEKQAPRIRYLCCRRSLKALLCSPWFRSLSNFHFLEGTGKENEMYKSA